MFLNKNIHCDTSVEQSYGDSSNEGSKHIQSTLVISKSKGPSETLRDICTSTYHVCRIKENTNRTTKFHK